MFEINTSKHNSKNSLYLKLNKGLEGNPCTLADQQVILQTISLYADYYESLDTHIPVVPINSSDTNPQIIYSQGDYVTEI